MTYNYGTLDILAILFLVLTVIIEAVFISDLLHRVDVLEERLRKNKDGSIPNL